MFRKFLQYPNKKWCDWVLKINDTFDTILQYLKDEVSEVVYE